MTEMLCFRQIGAVNTDLQDSGSDICFYNG